MKFENLIEKQVLLISRFLDPKSTPIEATIIGVDSGGIWIKTAFLVDYFNKIASKFDTEANTSFFLPFHNIDFAIAVTDIKKQGQNKNAAPGS